MLFNTSQVPSLREGGSVTPHRWWWCRHSEGQQVVVGVASAVCCVLCHPQQDCCRWPWLSRARQAVRVCREGVTVVVVVVVMSGVCGE